jgi:hypothetical protein
MIAARDMHAACAAIHRWDHAKVAGAPLLALAVLVVLAAPASGQGFEVGTVALSPTVGFGSIDEAGLAFGGRVEWGYRAVPELANGIIGIQLSADF